MSKNPAKDFGAIADDYLFFETYSTEPQNDALAYAEQLKSFASPNGVVRMLDFGCGSGNFTTRLLKLVGWPPERLRLTLVEPAEAVRKLAVERLARFLPTHRSLIRLNCPRESNEGSISCSRTTFSTTYPI